MIRFCVEILPDHLIVICKFQVNRVLTLLSIDALIDYIISFGVLIRIIGTEVVIVFVR